MALFLATTSLKYMEIIAGPMVLKKRQVKERAEPYMQMLMEQVQAMSKCLLYLHFACTLAHLMRSGHVAAAHPPIYYNSFLTQA